MTENEIKAIKWIKSVRDDAVITLDHIQKNEPNVSPMLYAGRKKKAETIMEMCEELEQYRAIGTVEQLRTMFDGFWKLKDLCEEYEKYGLPEDYWKLNEICKEYSAIGTVKELINTQIREKVLNTELETYKEIGTAEEFKALKEKSKPKKVIRLSDNEYYDYECPTCGLPDKDCMGKKYCNCGQALEI